MTERPILFSAPMVRAILDGRKTQTRRPVKPRKDIGFGCLLQPNEIAGEINSGQYEYSVFGQPGEHLWVREAFQPLYADGIESESETNWKTGKGYAISYPATDGIKEYLDPDDNISSACKPSIHMPRWASRILLEITSVRVERLQDISEADAKAEGTPHSLYHPSGRTAVENFRHLWECINGDGSWDENPWVWVIEFKATIAEKTSSTPTEAAQAPEISAPKNQVAPAKETTAQLRERQKGNPLTRIAIE